MWISSKGIHSIANSFSTSPPNDWSNLDAKRFKTIRSVGVMHPSSAITAARTWISFTRLSRSRGCNTVEPREFFLSERKISKRYRNPVFSLPDFQTGEIRGPAPTRTVGLAVLLVERVFRFENFIANLPFFYVRYLERRSGVRSHSRPRNDLLSFRVEYWCYQC